MSWTTRAPPPGSAHTSHAPSLRGARTRPCPTVRGSSCAVVHAVRKQAPTVVTVIHSSTSRSEIAGALDTWWTSVRAPSTRTMRSASMANTRAPNPSRSARRAPSFAASTSGHVQVACMGATPSAPAGPMRNAQPSASDTRRQAAGSAAAASANMASTAAANARKRWPSAPVRCMVRSCTSGCWW